MKSKYILFLLGAMIIFLLSNMALYYVLIQQSQGDAKQINDIGRIRGGIQRIIKLEFAGEKNDELISRIDLLLENAIIADKSTNSIIYFDTARLLLNKWENLKYLIVNYRENKTESTKVKILDASEEIWEIADATVIESQLENERNVDNFKYTLILLAMNIMITALIIYFTNVYVKDELEFYANHDPLTKIYNRKFFMSYFTQTLQQVARYKQDLSVVMIDIDNFKQVNDTYGHDIGDVVLIEVANIIKSNTRKSDIVSRFGGEEFIVLFPNTMKDNAYSVSEKIRCAVEENRFKTVGKITISLGVYTYNKGDDENSMIHKADNALYQAKKTGKNKVVAFQ
jgi:diguanylate cyclase (GGDEF)-like protein